MPDDPFKEVLGEVIDKLYGRVLDLYPDNVDGGAFPWAKEHRRDLYDTMIEWSSRVDDEWDRVDTGTFRKTVLSLAKAILDLHKAYGEDKKNRQKAEGKSESGGGLHDYVTSRPEPAQGSLL